MPDNETLIIGAGFAGLAAARALDAAGHGDFQIFEARDRVGGRTMPGRLGPLDIDLGGMWLGASQNRLRALADEYGCERYPTHLDGRAIYRLAGREHHGRGESFDGLFDLLDVLGYALVERKLDRLIDELDCEQPWNHPLAAELDRTTVASWLRRHVPRERLRAMLRMVCIAVFCAEADQVSMLFFLHYLKSGDGLDTLISAAPGGAQHELFSGGLHQLAARMGQDCGARLQLETPVRRVIWGAEGVRAETESGEWRARNAIIAVPPSLIPRIEFEPLLPAAKRGLCARLVMGSAIKFWVLYPTPFWREQGFNGLILRDDHPATPVMDVSPPQQPHGVLAGFFDGQHALDHADDTSDTRRDIVIHMLAEHFGAEALEPIDYVDHDWNAEHWSGGCYGNVAPPGVYARHARWLREPVGPLLWAGTETSSAWTGYVEGAIRSGERAAADLIGQRKSGKLRP